MKRFYRVGSKKFLAISEIVSSRTTGNPRGFGFWVGNRRVAVTQWGSLIEVNLFGWTTTWSLR